MLKNIIIWFSAICSILGIIFYLYFDVYKTKNIIPKTPLAYILVSIGLIIAVVFSPTDLIHEKNSSDDKGAHYEVKNGNIFKDITSKGNTTITVGTTNEEKEEKALESIKNEILDNITNFTFVINIISDYEPTSFWDIKKPNETETNYQTRATQDFLKYNETIGSYLKRLNYKNSIYSSYQRDINNKEVSDETREIYKCFDEVNDSLISYKDDLNHIHSLNLKDQVRAKKALLQQKKRINDAKSFLIRAVRHFYVYSSDSKFNEYCMQIAMYLSTANIDIQLSSDKKYISNCIEYESKLAKEKVTITQEMTDALKEQIGWANETRNISPIVTDPYLVWLRKLVGLPEQLSEGEVAAISHKELNLNETDPEKLLLYVSDSFLSCDGEASIEYLEKILELDTINDKIRKYSELSLLRLQNPELFKDSMGLFILEVLPDSNFDKAGIKYGDVLVSIDGEMIIEPEDISKALANNKKDSPILINLIRDGEELKHVIKSGQSAGASMTPLVTMYCVQL